MKDTASDRVFESDLLEANSNSYCIQPLYFKVWTETISPNHISLLGEGSRSVAQKVWNVECRADSYIL